MKTSREMLEDRLERDEQELAGLSAFLKELETTTKKLGTDREQVEEDWVEAEHNIKFYRDEIAKIKKDLGKSGKSEPSEQGGGGIMPSILKPTLDSLMFCSIGFIVGAIFGSLLTSRGSSRDSR